MPFHRRRLPHCHPPGATLFITFCLAGSLPRNRRFPANQTAGQAFAAMDQLLDGARTGPMWLSIPEVANAFVDSLKKGRDLQHYSLDSFVVMPNHVHLLLVPLIPVPRLLQSLKSSSARWANRALGRTGRLWQDEYYDHRIRTEREHRNITLYIENNPVRAGLCHEPEQFRFSSAFCGARGGADSQSAEEPRSDRESQWWGRKPGTGT